jgi:hypothetical protein
LIWCFRTSTKEFHIYDWKRVKEISYDSTFNKFAKNKVYISHLQTFGIIASIEHHKAILEAKYEDDLYLIVSSGQSSKTYEKIECMDLTKEVGICLRSDV